MLISLDKIKKKLKKENVIPVAREYFSDSITAVSAFLRLKEKSSQSFFLESIEGGEKIGRYSFLGIDPFEIIKVKEGNVYIESDEKQFIKTDKPFKIIDHYLKKYRALTFEELPPFCGGAIGHVNYEAIRYIEKIPPLKAANPLESEAYDIFLMLFKDVIAFDNLKNRLIIITNIILEDDSHIDLDNKFTKAQQHLEKLQNKIFTKLDHELDLFKIDNNQLAPAPIENATLGEENYIKAVKIIKQHIRKGDIFQAVLSDQFTVKITTDPFKIYRALRSITPAPYLFFMETGAETLLGASPEMLVRVKKGTIETCPIAGTRPRGKDEKEDKVFARDLLKSVKERAEHVMLVDLGRNDIGRVARPGTVTVTEFMQVQRYSNVMHLVSLVQGKLKRNRSAWEAFQACFPAGTLSGAPKIRAMEIINELEPVARGPYGGAIIYSDFSRTFDSCITIRSLRIKDGVGTIQAGAGIVHDSRAAHEYQEVLDKSCAIRNAISLAQSIKKESE